MSVEAKPMRITFVPLLVTPAENASASSGEEGRISSPMITVLGSRSISRNLAKAKPTANAKSGESSSSTRPRMSYALKISGISSLMTDSFNYLFGTARR